MSFFNLSNKPSTANIKTNNNIETQETQDAQKKQTCYSQEPPAHERELPSHSLWREPIPQVPGTIINIGIVSTGEAWQEILS